MASAADQRVLAQDWRGARGGERVLVVDVRIADPHHHFSRGEIVKRDLVEARADAAVVAVNAVGAESGHGMLGGAQE
jgi:hypothetical protein